MTYVDNLNVAARKTALAALLFEESDGDDEAYEKFRDSVLDFKDALIGSQKVSSGT